MKIFFVLVSVVSLFYIGSYELQTGAEPEPAELEYIMEDNFFFKEGTYHRKIEDSIHKYSNSLEEKRKIELKMYGLDRNLIHEPGDHTIDTFVLTYGIDRQVGYQEARTLFYEVADGFIAHMNKETELFQYFYKPPIGYEHLDFKLSFDYDRAGHLKVGDIAAVLIRDGKIHYSVVEKESPEQIEFIPTGDSEVFTLGNFCFNTHWVTRSLPETEQDAATEP